MRILFCWEMGGGIGHLYRMAPIGAEFLKQGCEVIWAIPELNHAQQFIPYCSLNILEVSLILLYRCKLWHPCPVVQGFWFAGAIVVLFAV